MKFLKLTLTNFRNIKQAEYTFGKENIFEGFNGIGKSNILDAFYFVVCGETNAYGGSSDEQYNETKGTELEAKVELELECGSRNRKHLFTRTIKKRMELNGNKEWEFKEHKKTYQIDDDKYTSAGAYYAQIRKYLGLTLNKFNEIKFLMDSNYLNTIDYKLSRQYFLDFLTLPSDEELLNDKKFDLLKDDLLDTFEDSGKKDVLDVLATQKKRFETRQRRNNNLIAQNDYELNQNKTKLFTEEEETKATETIDKLKEKEKEIINSTIDTDKFTKEQVKLNNKLGTLTATLQTVVTDKEKAVNNTVNVGRATRNKMDSIIREKNYVFKEIQSKEGFIARNIEGLTQFDFAIQSLESKKYVSNSTCPNCGFELDGDNLKAQKERDLEQLKTLKGRKSTLVEQTETKNKSLESEIKLAKEKIVKFDTDYEELQAELDKENARYQALNKELQEAKDNLSNVANSDEAISIKESIKASSEQLQETKQTHKAKKQADYEKNKAKLETLLFERTKRSNYKNALEERKLLDLESQELIIKLKQLDTFKKVKIDVIQTAADALNIGLKLQYYTDGDTLKQCCTLVENGIDYVGVNDGNKYLLGIKAIEGIKKIKGIEDLPIIINRMGDIDSNTMKTIKSLTNSQLFFTKVLNVDDKVRDFKEALTFSKVEDIDTKVAEYRKEIESDKSISLIIQEA